MKRATLFQWLVVLGIIFCVCIGLLIVFLYSYTSFFYIAHPDPSIEVSTNLPAAHLNAVLHLEIGGPDNPLATNNSDSYWHEYGSVSLYNSGGNGGIYGGDGSFGISIDEWDEHRLIAINSEGFYVLFSEGWKPAGVIQKYNQQTNIILFRYGQVTETNTIGLKIIGKFK